ncbi:MAG TPA: HTH domain-containing protein [Bacteroidales bacterium]|nr:HTH domain-containing protein [Bacteroidales bacterium]
MLLKQINRLQYIDQLIRQKRTGNAEEFARRLNISRRQLYYWLEELKDMGLEIGYNRTIRSYVFLKPYKIEINFQISELSDKEINGGGSRICVNKILTLEKEPYFIL